MTNIWREFEKLLPKQEAYIGTVDSVDTSKGISYITLISGQDTIAQGTSVSAGSNCIIQNGVVISEAPTLDTMTEITIY